MADPFFDKRRRFGLWQHGSATEAVSEPVLGFGTDLAIIKKALWCLQTEAELCPGREEGGGDAPGHVLGSEQQAAVPAAAGTACTPAPTQLKKCPNHSLVSAKLLHFSRWTLQSHSSVPSSPSPFPFLNIFGNKLP